MDDIMVSMTENAAAELKKILKKEDKSGCGLRIFIAGAGCAGPQYGIGIEEKAQEDDTVFESQGVKIFVGKSVVGDLDGSIIDYKETPQGPGFLITNPNVSSCCGDSSSCH